jgi:hypothetical protein
MAPVIWALTLLACAPTAPSFEAWVTDAVSRCTPGATSTIDCSSGPCLAIVRTPTGEELDVKGCMRWPYTGLGTAVSQLPTLEGVDVQAVLAAEAERIATALDASTCP